MAPREFPSEFLLGDNFVAKPREFPSEFMLPSAPTPGPQPVDMSSDTSDVLPLDNDIPMTGGFLKWKDPINALGQAGGAVIGAPFAGPTMGLSVVGGAAGGNILTNRVVDKLNQWIGGKSKQVDESELVSEGVEGALGVVGDKLAGPVLKLGARGLRSAGEAIEGIGSKIGITRGNPDLPFLGVDRQKLVDADPNFNTPSSEAMKGTQGVVTEFNKKEAAPINQRWQVLQESGYLHDVSDLESLREKVAADVGGYEMVPQTLPDGSQIMEERFTGGNLTRQRDAVLQQLEAASGGAGIPFQDIALIANNQLGAVSSQARPLQRQAITNVFPDALANLQAELGPSPTITQLSQARQQYDKWAKEAFDNGTDSSSAESNAYKIIANSLREAEESMATRIDPTLASDYIRSKNQIRLIESIYPTAFKAEVSNMKGKMGGTVMMPATKRGVFESLRDLIMPSASRDSSLIRSQLASRGRGNPVTADLNTSALGLGTKVANTALGAPGGIVEGALKGGSAVMSNPGVSQVVGTGLGREAAGMENPMKGIMPGQEAPQAQASPFASLTPQRISQAMPGQQMTPAPTPRNTVSIQQNPDQFLTQLFEAASQPRLPEENALPPEVLQGRAAKMVYDVQKMLRSGNNAMIAETMQGMSRMFPEIFEDGFSSQWDGMIADPAERGYFLKDLNIKLERKEISRSFHAKQVSEMNEYGKILDAPAPQRAPAPQPQPSPRIQTSIGAMRQPAY